MSWVKLGAVLVLGGLLTCGCGEVDDRSAPAGDSDADSDTDADSDVDSDSDTDSDTDTGADTDSGSDTDSGTGSDTDSDTDTDSHTDSDSDTDSDTGTDTGTDTGIDTDTGTGGEDDYWTNGYCPGWEAPASLDCKEVGSPGLCDDATHYLVCDTDKLYCFDCAAEGYVCGWNDLLEQYDCVSPW